MFDSLFIWFVRLSAGSVICLFQGQTQYLLKWKGFSDADNTWVAESDLSCQELLKEFNEREQEAQQTGLEKQEQNKEEKSKKNLRKRSASKVLAKTSPKKVQIDMKQSDTYTSIISN